MKIRSWNALALTALVATLFCSTLLARAHHTPQDSADIDEFARSALAQGFDSVFHVAAFLALHLFLAALLFRSAKTIAPAPSGDAPAVPATTH
jgi:hypothetical protein